MKHNHVFQFGDFLFEDNFLSKVIQKHRHKILLLVAVQNIKRIFKFKMTHGKSETELCCLVGGRG